MRSERMLLGREKFWVRGTGIGGACSDGDRGIDIESDGREADFVVAGLVAQLERNMLRAEGSIGLGGERNAQDDFILVHVERSLGEGEGAEFAFGVGDFAGGFETGGGLGAENRGDEAVRGWPARGDVKDGAGV